MTEFLIRSVIFNSMYEKHKEHLFILGLILALLPYAYLCFFTFPVADDFVFSTHFRDSRFSELLKRTYLGWNGRYSSNFFAYLNPLGFNSYNGYKTASLLTIIFLIGAISFLIRQVLFQLTLKMQLSISLVFSLLFLHNMPIISEGIYWYTGASIYTLGTAFVFIYTGALLKGLREKWRAIYQIGLLALLFLCCGFNEVLTFLVVFFLGSSTLISYQQKKENKKWFLLQFLFALCCTFLMVFSPGNECRGEQYLNANNLSYSFMYSLAQVGRFLASWIFSAPLMVASILYLSLKPKFSENNEWFKNDFYLSKWRSFIGLVIIVFICVFPPYWATGILGQHRTLNVAYAFFLPFWFINLSIWSKHYTGKLTPLLKKRSDAVLVGILLVGLIFTGNGYNALEDLFSGSAKNYLIQLKQRTDVLEKVLPNEKKLMLEPLNYHPKSLFIIDLATEPSNWINRSYTLYFQKDSLDIYSKK